MARVHNFSAGPAALPTSVLAEIADEMMDYRGCGMSVLEMSHRSSMYQQIIDDVEATLRRLLSIPDNYRVLFLQGGATLQFAGIPMNLMRRGRAGYIVTGNFANKAYKEAAKYGEAVLLASSKDTNFDRIPTMADVNARIAAEAASNGLDYVYICQNNTIFGTMYHELPNCGDVPLVADVSSCFLSQPLDVERYGLIYAGAQKNAGARGRDRGHRARRPHRRWLRLCANAAVHGPQGPGRQGLHAQHAQHLWYLRMRQGVPLG